MTRLEAEAYRQKIEKAAASQNDNDALNSIELFPKWKENIEVSVGQRYQHINKLWKVVQSHTTQSNWEPQDTPSLFTEVTLDEWPEWVQPTGAQDAYNTGDKITYNEVHYVSLIDGNIWDPITYPSGWQQQ